MYYNYPIWDTNDKPFVDLDLPSGTLWAACNVGASKPSDAGLYFQWGDTQGYTANQVGKDKQFNWANYKWSIDGSDSNFRKYTTTGAMLELEDDAAHINMGGDWHMPMPTQIQELLNNTTNTWTTQDGVNGRLFTSKKDASKSIFIPTAGYVSNGSQVVTYVNEAGVWSSMLDTGNVSNGQSLYFYASDVSLYNEDQRYFGNSVRGVLG